MVKYAQILSSNDSHFSSLSSNQSLTAVFAGATSGIGLGTLRALLKHTATSSTMPTIYIVGRTGSQLSKLTADLQPLNPSANLVPIEAGDLSQVSNARKAAGKVKETADKVDLLIMSPGYVALKRDDNGEGVDRCTALRYYSRTQILVTLAPLLRRAPSPRVVTVLAGGKEGPLDPEDWLFKNGYSVPKVADATGSYVSLSLEEFAKQPGNEKISLIHLFPGLVGGTGLFLDGAPFWLKWFAPLGSLVLYLFGYSIEEVGERVLYAAMRPDLPSRAKGGEGPAKGSNGEVGSGVYLVDSDSSVIPGNKVLTGHRAKETGEKVWSHTVKVLEDIERNGRTE